MAKNEVLNSTKNFANNLKTTNLGMSFAKTLFTEPDKLSPKQILNTLKSLGLEIPDELTVTAELAQVIVSGQAINDAVNAGATLTDVKSLTNTTGAGVRTINSIAMRNGWIDTDTASIVSYGTNIGMIVASAGLNVAAWIGLALDVAATIASKQALADQRAALNLQSKIKARLTPQAKILADTFVDFQNEKIGIYGLIAKMAHETPDLWPQVVHQNSPFTQMFPELMMLPTVKETVTGYGENTIWGDWPWPASGSYVIASWSSSKSAQLTTINKMSKEDAAAYFFSILLKPWLTVYALANEEIVSRGNMAMGDVAALSFMVNPSGEISATDDYVGMLMGANLTPYDFGDPILDNIASDYLEGMYQNTPHQFIESGVVLSNTPSKNAGFSSYQKDRDIMLQKLRNVRGSDSVWELTKYPYIYARLKSYMDFEVTSFEKDPSVGGRISHKFPEGHVRAWRKLHNYVACMQTLDTFRTDSYLRNTKFVEQLMPFMPSVDAFQDKVDRIHYLSTMRAVNNMALNEVATFLGVKVSDLQKLTAADHIGAAKFTVK